MRWPTPPTGPDGAAITNIAPGPATTPATASDFHDQRSTTAVLTATRSLGGPSPRRSEVGYSPPGLVPGQEHAVGKRPGLHQVQVHPLVHGSEERRAAAHQDRVGDDRVLVDQPGP